MKKKSEVITSFYLPEHETYEFHVTKPKVNLYNVIKSSLAIWGLFTIVWICFVFLVGG